MGARRPALSWKARFASITFWFATSHKKNKIVATFHRLDIYLNCDCDRGSAPDPAGELIALRFALDPTGELALPRPHLDLRWPLRSAENENNVIMKRAGQSGGREGMEWRDERRTGERRIEGWRGKGGWG